MPSVASEAHRVLTSQFHLPSARSQSQADARDATTPFSELLDSANPPAEPPPATRNAQAERPDRADRADAAAPADNRKADPATKAKDSTDAGTHTKDSKDGNGSADATANAAGDTAAGDTADAKAGENAKDSDASASPDAGDKSKLDADKAAALEALLNAAAPATPAVTAETGSEATVVAATQPQLQEVAPAEGDAPAADALAALQAAGQQSVPNGAPKAAQPSDDAKTDTQSDTQTKGTAAAEGAATAENAAAIGRKAAAEVPATPDRKDTTEGKGRIEGKATAEGPATVDPQTAAPEIASGKDGQAHGDGDGERASADVRHAAAEALKKLGIDTPAQNNSDTGGAVKAGADAMQNIGVTAPANAASTAVNSTSAAANAPAPTPAVAVPLSGLAVEITTQAHAGKNHFEIRLDPPELGRIDVKLDFDGDGNVSTRLVVDRADTLDLLKRDAASLERALQQSGLKTSDNALEFSLRQQAFAHDDTAAQNAAQLIVPDDDPAPLEALRQGYGRLLGLGGGLDIRV